MSPEVRDLSGLFYGEIRCARDLLQRVFPFPFASFISRLGPMCVLFVCLRQKRTRRPWQRHLFRTALRGRTAAQRNVQLTKHK